MAREHALVRSTTTGRVGARIGSYRLVERIGYGGMGEVWSAVHTGLHQQVAIKLVMARATDLEPGARGTRLERFEREARATAGLTSPHTVRIHDFGRAPGGRFFYAMELLDGLDLEALVDEEGPLEPARAVHVLQQMLASLAEAHARGLLHRDIKPANVLLCRQGLTDDFVKVLDFGLVKDLGGGDGLTADEALLGSPGFMAPEALHGQAALGPRSDLYSVGCVAYWLLTGALVFEREHPLSVVIAHAHEPVPPPSTRTERALPGDLEALVLRCLAKDPAERPASATALQRELAACDVGEPWTAADAERRWAARRGRAGRAISEASTRAPTDPPPRPARALVVDDDAAVRLVLTRLLAQAGYEALPAASGEEALDLLAARAVDVVLTDLRMPGMGGMRLIDEIMRRDPDLPVVVLSAHGTVPLAVEAMQRGAGDFLLKPFDRADVCRVIDAALARGLDDGASEG